MLYLPVGPPGAGKSTLCDWAIEHGVITADAVVCPDQIRLWLTGDRSRQDFNDQVFRIVRQVVNCRLELGLDVFLDATNLPPPRFAAAKEVKVIVLDTPLTVLWERNRTREHPVPDDVLARMVAKFTNWFTTRSDPSLGSTLNWTCVTASDFMESQSV